MLWTLRDLVALDSSAPPPPRTENTEQVGHSLRSDGYHEWNIVPTERQEPPKSPGHSHFGADEDRVGVGGLFQRNVE